MRWTPFLLVASLLAVVAGFTLTMRGSAAAQSVGQWALYERAGDVPPFRAALPGVIMAQPAGYEIVGLGAVGVSDSLADYHYAGPDFTPPLPPIVGCTANVEATVIRVGVTNAYPYAGCVFYIGVENQGPGPLRVSLGQLDASVPVACAGGVCQGSDIDVMAGGRTAAAINQLCVQSGPPVTGDANLVYTIPAGSTFICPLFIVVLQPACENCTYSFTVTPPPTESTVISGNTPTPTPETPVPTQGIPETPTPVPTATRTLTPPPAETPSATATPLTPTVEATAGVRTPGTGTATVISEATPRPPDTGNVLIRHTSDGSGGAAGPLLLVAGLLLFALTVVVSRMRREESPLLREAAGRE